MVHPVLAGVIGAWLLAAAGEPLFTVALDPGHGGSNRGAPTARPEYFEKHLTLTIAKRVQELLAGDKNLRVVLCRERDVLVPLRTRVRRANRAGARLFISIHANAASAERGPGSQRGFEIYMLSVSEVEQEAAHAALLESDGAHAAWAAHRTRRTAAETLAAARRIRWRLADALGADRDGGIKQVGATLDILQGLHMPAVLVEVGFLDHPEEGPFLLSEDGIKTISTALAGAITDLRGRELRGHRDPMTTAPQSRKRALGAAGETP
jgi:N-acetylmuramoyl-L-alanine amidase